MAVRDKRKRRRSARQPLPQRMLTSDPLPEPATPVLILNRAAARGRAAATWERRRRELRSWRSRPQIVETEGPGHAAELARAAAADGASLVIAAGGDGTAHEVLQGLMEIDAPASGTAFAHLPLGTGCDLARGLGLPRRSTGILRGLRHGRHTYIDVGVADMAVGGRTVRRYFFNAATLGIGPAVARRVASSTGLQRLGRHAYTVAAVQELFAARPYQVGWNTDDGQRGEMLSLHLFINNGPSVAGGMRPSPEASFSDGELHVVAVGALGLGAALYQFLRLDRGLPFSHPDIHAFSCRSIDIEGPEIDIETDGERAGCLPARLWVRPGALLVRMPG